MFSAASGNIVSSLIFVPKEVIKQKLQSLNMNQRSKEIIATAASAGPKSMKNVNILENKLDLIRTTAKAKISQARINRAKRSDCTMRMR